MRIVFIGSPPFAREAFQALSRHPSGLAGLVTAPDRPAGRGRHAAPNSLAEEARSLGIPVLQPERARDAGFLRSFAEWQPDLGVVVGYGQILSRAFLETPAHGCINLHGSLLPRWRGASPVQAAILAGDAATGVSIQRVVEELDAGPVLAQRELRIGSRETAPELTARLARAGAELLTEFLDAIGAGPLPQGASQDPAQITHCRRLRKEEGRLDWSQTGKELDRRVRAMAGWPVAETRLPDGAPLKVLAGVPQAGRSGEMPGVVLQAGPGLIVQCGDGAYRIERVQRAGKAAMDAADFLRGAQLAAGARLGGAAAEDGA